MTYDKIANIIKTARLRRKLTQLELAQLVGVTKGAVSQWEKGTSTPSRKVEAALARALGITSSELEAALSSGLSLLDSVPQGREIPFLRWEQLIHINMPRRDTGKVNNAYTDSYSGSVVVVEGDTPADAIAASVEDESMEPEYHAGDIIIFSASVVPRKDDAVVAAVGDGHVLRHYSPRGKNKAGDDVYDLLSVSPEFPTISSGSARLLGVVIEHRRKRR